MSELIDDPIKIIALCNRHIRKLESLIETCNDEKLIAKYEGHLVAWVELLEKATYQAYQQGKTKTDITEFRKR